MRNMIKELIRNNYRTTEDVCAILNMSRMTLYRKETSGQITGYRIGRRKYFRNVDIQNFVSNMFSNSISEEEIRDYTTI
jgi:excisionase family DNA binding protein